MFILWFYYFFNNGTESTLFPQDSRTAPQAFLNLSLLALTSSVCTDSRALIKHKLKKKKKNEYKMLFSNVLVN